MNKNSSPWLNFEDSLTKWMRQFEGPNLIFKNSHQAIPGFPSTGFRSDGLLTNGDVLLALEVEVKQAHPDTNVGKYWLLSKYEKYEKVILLHVYTPEFNSYGWRKELAEFYASKMTLELPFEYEILDLRNETEIDSAFEEVTQKLADHIKVEFLRELPQ